MGRSQYALDDHVRRRVSFHLSTITLTKPREAHLLEDGHFPGNADIVQFDQQLTYLLRSFTALVELISNLTTLVIELHGVIAGTF